ncbi:MAG: phosphotransferase [Pseudomonadota bacterium]
MSTPSADSIIRTHFPHHKIKTADRVQSLWSNYGEIVRYHLGNQDTSQLQNNNNSRQTVILKWVELPDELSVHNHPRGWSSQVSNQRKISSYINEQRFYSTHSINMPDHCYVPKYIASDCFPLPAAPQIMWLLMEDLDALGFDQRFTVATLDQAKRCIDWLANYHAHFLPIETKTLWRTGTYWHLDTRQDEYNAMSEGSVKIHARAIDQKLANAHFKTLVHGDAKVANFCFDTRNNRVAAVDFQYTGRGVGVRDLVYFLGSCFFGRDLVENESVLKEYYFNQLRNALTASSCAIDADLVIAEWRDLYPFCWADFERFLLGWAPTHNKLSGFSKKMTDIAINQLKKDDCNGSN